MTNLMGVALVCAVLSVSFALASLRIEVEELRKEVKNCQPVNRIETGEGRFIACDKALKEGINHDPYECNNCRVIKG